MGQVPSSLAQAASLFSKYTPNYHILRSFDEEHYGEIKFVQDIETGRRMFLKEVIFETKDAFQEEVDYFAKRMQISHPNIVHIVGFDSHTGQNFCSRIYKLLIFIELSGKDLGHELEERISQDKPFSESLLLMIAENLISALAYLQSHDLTHGDIRPRNIFASGNNYKLFDPSLSPQKELNGLGRAIISREETFLSPELVLQVPKNQLTTTGNKFKSDVFSVGVTLLSLASLTKGEELYNYEVGMIANGLLQNRLALVKKQYSMLTYELIRTMLIMEEANRPDFEDLQTRLAPFKEKIRQGRNPLASGSPSGTNQEPISPPRQGVSAFEGSSSEKEELRRSKDHASLAEQVETKPQKKIFDGAKKGRIVKGPAATQENVTNTDSQATTERKRIFDKGQNKENQSLHPLVANILHVNVKEKPMISQAEAPLQALPLQTQDIQQLETGSIKSIPQTPKSQAGQDEVFNFDYANQNNGQGNQETGMEFDNLFIKTPFDDLEDDAPNKSLSMAVAENMKRSHVYEEIPGTRDTLGGTKSSQHLHESMNQSRRNDMMSSQKDYSQVNIKMEEDPALQYSYANLQPHSEIIEHGESLNKQHPTRSSMDFGKNPSKEEENRQLAIEAVLKEFGSGSRYGGMSKSGVLQYGDNLGYGELPTYMRSSYNFESLRNNPDMAVNRGALSARDFTSSSHQQPWMNKENKVQVTPQVQQIQEIEKALSPKELPPQNIMMPSPRPVLDDVTNKNPETQQQQENEEIVTNKEIKDNSDIFSLNLKSALSEGLDDANSASGWFDFSYEFAQNDMENKNPEANKLEGSSNPIPQYSNLFPQKTFGQESNLMNMVLNSQPSTKNYIEISNKPQARPEPQGFEVDLSEIHRGNSERIKNAPLQEINQNLNQQTQAPFMKSSQPDFPATTLENKPATPMKQQYSEYPNLFDSGIGQMYPTGQIAQGMTSSSATKKNSDQLYNLLDLSVQKPAQVQEDKENYNPQGSIPPQTTNFDYLGQITSPALKVNKDIPVSTDKEIPSKILDYSVKLSESFNLEPPKMGYSSNADLLNQVLSDRPTGEVQRNVDFPLRSSQELFNYGRNDIPNANIASSNPPAIDDLSFLVNQALARTQATMNQMRPEPYNQRPYENNLLAAPKNFDFLSASIHTSMPGYNPSHP